MCLYNENSVTGVCEVQNSTGLAFVRTSGEVKIVSLLRAANKEDVMARFRFPQGNGKAEICYITSAKDLLVAKGPSSVFSYHITQHEQKKHNLTFQPKHVMFYTDGYLLISDHEHSSLHMYELEHSEGLRLVWSCENLRCVSAVCIAENGLIVARSSKANQIWIISAQGRCF